MAQENCKSMQEMMAESLWDAEAPDALQQHLASCPACHRLFLEMRGALQMVAEPVYPALPEAYWDSFYDRLADRMQPERRRSNASLVAIRERLRSRLASWAPLPAPAARLGFALALILVGVIIGRFWGAQTGSTEITTVMTPALPPDLAPAQLTARAQRYLDRSNVLLLGLVNFNTMEDNPIAINLDRKKVVAAELVEEAGMLKADLSRYREQQLVQLVDDLERILLQIANLEAQLDAPAIEVIQQGVDHGSLLLKINLEQMRLVDREAERAPAGLQSATGML